MPNQLAMARDSSGSTRKNVFVIGLDDFNRRKLEIANPDGTHVFVPLLSLQEVTAGESWSLDAALRKAKDLIDATPGGADAIIGYWDFPVSLLVPILCRQVGLVSPTLESILKCEHKYWSRLEQRQVAEEHVPPFQIVDPFDDESVARIALGYPCWLKPVKSFASHLGFRIRNQAELHSAISTMRANIRELGNPFNQFLAKANLPPNVAQVDGNHCIAEGLVIGRQCTLEGFVFDGAVEIYGVVDSIRHANRSTFARYEYPSRLPDSVKQRMAHIARLVIERIGLNHSSFNIEFFWERKRNHLWLLEINPRISQSHGDLFEKVDGLPHHRVVVELALGRHPKWSKGGGEFRIAGKFFLRRFQDAIVTRIPSEEEVEQVRHAFPGTLIEINATEGMRLSELAPQDQDSYSYIYALLFIGAVTRQQLMERHRKCVDMLPFGFAETPGVTAGTDGHRTGILTGSPEHTT